MTEEQRETTVPGEHVLLADVTFVFIARSRDTRHVRAWLDGVGKDASLAGVSVIVWHSPDVAADISAATQDVESAFQLFPRETATGDSPESVGALLGHIKTDYCIITTLTKYTKQALNRLKKKARRARRLMTEIPPLAGSSLLLSTGTCPRSVMASYLSVVLGREAPSDVTVSEYLGFLALQTSIGTVESVDTLVDGVKVCVRLNFGALDLVESPPWRFVISLAASDGTRIDSEPAVLKQRVSMYGYARWEFATAAISLGEVASGEYRVVVSLVSDVQRLAHRSDLRPTVGLLLNARTVHLDLKDQRRPASVRYLVHTTADTKVTRVTLQRSTIDGPATRWTRALLKKDVKFIASREAPRRMRSLRLLRLLTSPLMGRRAIWLIGERIGTAQDNGFHLFRHLRTEHPRRRVYYIIDKDSSQYDRVRPFGQVIGHSSLRHRLLMLHAEVLADAYSISYLIPRQWNREQYGRHLAWRIGALRVYLKHGVHMSPNALKRGATGYDMLLTVTPRETEALAASSGYAEQLTEVGLPRYDALVPTAPSRMVLFMSTWRRYLVPKVFGGENKDQTAYEGSTYDMFMKSLLGSERLDSVLRAHNYRMVFLPHHNLAHNFENASTASDRVSIADTDSDTFQALIRDCDAFVTDHSSVSFDVAYLGTPMIYARFDKEEFERRHVAPSWFDHERDGFGPVTYNLEEMLDELERLLERECTQDELYAQRVEATFTYRDQGNCRRTVAAIDSLLDAHVGNTDE